MRDGFRLSVAALGLGLLCVGATSARAGDDGAAPLWEGIGSIFTPLLGVGDVGGILGFGGEKEEKPPIDYHEHGKIVVPKTYELPPPSSGTVASEGGAWPVNQEIQRKKLRKEAAKKVIGGQGDARLRYTHPFPNAPVTVRAADEVGSTKTCANGNCDSTSTTTTAPSSPSVLGALNPLGWMGMGKAPPLGPEPDREWLTDPPKGYRNPAGQATN